MRKEKWIKDDYEYRIKMHVYPQRAKRVGLDHVYDELPEGFTKDTDFIITRDGKDVPLLKFWEDNNTLDYYNINCGYNKDLKLEKGTIVLDDFQVSPKRLIIGIPVDDDIKANKRKVRYYIYYNKERSKNDK
jgi:hypothetical protein